PGGTRPRDPAVLRRPHGAEQTAGVVRELGPHAASGGARQVPGPAHEGQTSRIPVTAVCSTAGAADRIREATANASTRRRVPPMGTPWVCLAIGRVMRPPP